MDVITCHINADFDALASMMAAKKLYPDAHLVFPGSQEKSMREFFMRSTIYALQVERMKNVDLDKVTRLILVDTKSRDRIGRFAEIVDRPGLKIHVYDHHPLSEDDIRGEFEHVEPLGACTTIFAEIFQEKNIAITPTEATIMALGIYEETGSLVFTSTKPRDIQAAAWLLGKGANLNIVADFITRELDADQVALLNDLLKSMEAYFFNSVKVVIATAASKKYIQDIAVLAHKIRDMENLDALFCVVTMEDRIHIVARSRVAEVDAGAIVEAFGGGGHPTAASATVRESTPGKVVERLVDMLRRSVRHKRTARDIMTRPVITIGDNASISETGNTMTRYSVNVLPVLHAGRLMGLVTREVVQKSLFHGLGDMPVKETMYTDFKTASPDTPVNVVEETMMRHGQRFLPVTEDKKVVGAITRTDLLRALHEELISRPRVEEVDVRGDEAFMRNLAEMMKERLPEETFRLLAGVGEKADETGVSAFIVGGFVRDLLLGVENYDLDIVVEGNGISFAHEFARDLGARVRSHQKFGTAVVVLPSGMKFDIATARTEYYEYPAALPTVELGSIKKDLYRRDFTINALAIKINREGFGELIDFFGGQRDVKERIIRVLHNLSLIEDPTRAFRAIRFETRMDFTISRHTQNLIKNAAKMDLFSRLAGGRIYTELALIFRESRPIRTMKRLDDFGLLKFIHPKIKYTKELINLFTSIGEALAWFKLLFLDVDADTWLVYFMGLFNFVPGKEVEELSRKLTVPERHMKKLRLARHKTGDILSEFTRNPKMKPYEVYLMLKPLPIETLLFMMAKARSVHAKKKISLFLTQYRDTQVLITGDDLMRMGLKPGPDFKKLLERLLEARLNGEVETREDEEALAAGYIENLHKGKGAGGRA